MRNFQLLATGLPVAAALAELETRPQLWRIFTGRQDTPGSAHRDTECIVLRGPASITMAAVFNDLDAHWYPHADLIDADALRAVLDAAIVKLGPIEQLGRVMVVNLKPEGHIDRHADEGAYAAHYERFHLALSAKPGNWFHCGDEAVYMKPGELWKFDHHTPHEVHNFSDSGRIHIIIDARREPAKEQ